jgi:hypothetical protein
MNTPACPTLTRTLTQVALTTLVIAGTLVVGTPALSKQVFAQENLIQSISSNQTLTESSLTAIPPRLGEDFSIKIKPGEKIQTSVKVRNSSSSPLTVQSIAQDFIVGDNGETPIPITDADVSNRWSLASWLILSPNVNQLAPGETAVVNVVIEVPADALPGGHYAMITHQPSTATAREIAAGIQPASASFLQQRVGTLIYVMVEGDINEMAFLRKFSVPKFTEYGPVPFSFEVDNQSDIHIRPQMAVEIYNIFGKKIETMPVETKNIFPFVARSFNGQWDRVWGFGPYTAQVVMSYGTGGQVAMAKTTFWLLPITLVLAGLVILLTLLAIIILIRRHVMHRKGNQQAEIELLQAKVRQLEEKKLDQFDT